MLSDLNWKRAPVRSETQCSRCARVLLAGQQSIQIDRSRVCIKCWDEVRADPTRSVQEYKSELRIGSGSQTRSSSTGGTGSRTRKPPARTEPTLSPYDASLHVGGVLDRAVEGTTTQLLSASDFDFHEAGFDYIAVGRSGVTIIGSRAYSSAVEIEALVSWSSTSAPANVLANGRNMRELVDLAVEQRSALEEIVKKASFKFDVPVNAALCFESVTGVDRTSVRESLGVRIDTAENIAKQVTKRGPVFETEIDEVVDHLRQAAATPAQPSPDRPPASD